VSGVAGGFTGVRLGHEHPLRVSPFRQEEEERGADARERGRIYNIDNEFRQRLHSRIRRVPIRAGEAHQKRAHANSLRTQEVNGVFSSRHLAGNEGTVQTLALAIITPSAR